MCTGVGWSCLCVLLWPWPQNVHDYVSPWLAAAVCDRVSCSGLRAEAMGLLRVCVPVWPWSQTGHDCVPPGPAKALFMIPFLPVWFAPKSAKECVKTHLPNELAPKMDGT